MDTKNPSFLLPARLWEVNAIYEGRTDIHRNLSFVLNEISKDPLSTGHSDVGIRNVLFMLATCIRPRLTLEIGGHIGTAAVTTASALALNGFGHHYVIEPDAEFATLLRQYTKQAHLEEWITVIEDFSDSQKTIDHLLHVAPFQMIFVDARHTYDAAKHDLELALILCEENGIIVLHDTSVSAMDYDETHSGGVRQALIDVAAQHNMPRIFFEWPLWVNKTGAALLIKQRI